MTLRRIALSTLCPPKGNPRRSIDKAAIAGLADSIKTDGVLQNLIVEKESDGKFRVISGSRRYLALRLLKRQGVIDGEYKVPVEIRSLQGDDALRIATVENVQRVNLDPIDEAEAFATMLQQGATIDELSAKTGLSSQTIRRRLALADLCADVKRAVQKGELPLGIAEAMTLGTTDQQRSLLKDLREGAEFDRDAIREMLCAEKPSVAIAIFPLENYTGAFTRDLFGAEETTYFDDAEQFFSLQKEAVEALAEKHRNNAAWVDVFNSYGVPWWQYREAKKREPAGVVINLKPTGLVEIKKGLVRHEVKEEVAEATKEAPEAPKEQPAVSAGLSRYAALHKSIAVQAVLLQNPRKAKEVVAVELLLAFLPRRRVHIEAHPCLTGWDATEKKPKAYTLVHDELARLSSILGTNFEDGATMSMRGAANGNTPLAVYQAVQGLSNEDLDRLSTLLVLLPFGQADVETLDSEDSLFNRVASDPGLDMRDWWTPDAEFLALMRKDQLEVVALESGASLRMGKLKGYSKKDLVSTLARHFERTADPAAMLDEHDQKGRAWLPGAMCFPARVAVTMADPH